jgi:hypothetical protein
MAEALNPTDAASDTASTALLVILDIVFPPIFLRRPSDLAPAFAH